MKYALIGCGGHAKEVIAQMKIDLISFVEDDYLTVQTKSLKEFNPNEYKVLITIADPKTRNEILKKLPKNTKFFTFIHPTALIMSDDIEIGEGSFIGAYSILTANIKLGKHSLLNRSCHIGHDTFCGDFLSMMPGSIISGNCKLGNRVYLGTNSSIREKITICDDVTIGLNTGIVKDINEKGVYVGSPAKKLIKKCEKI